VKSRVASTYQPEPTCCDLLLILYHQHRLSSMVEDAGLRPPDDWEASGHLRIPSFFSRQILDHLAAELDERLLDVVFPSVDTTPIDQKVFLWTRVITGRRIGAKVTNDDLNTLRNVRSAIAHGRHTSVEATIDAAPWRQPLDLDSQNLCSAASRCSRPSTTGPSPTCAPDRQPRHS